MIYQMLNEEQIIYVKNNHGKKTLPQIMDDLSIPRSQYNQFRHQTHKLELFRDKSEVRIPTKAHNFHNTEYWARPTVINCYLAGIVATDGCILIDRWGTYHYRHHLSVKDECILNLFKKELNFNGAITKHWQKSPNSDAWTEMAKIQIPCFEKNAAYLKQHFNLTPQKTKRLGPINLTDKILCYSFLIGVIDGDGYIGYRKSSSPNTLNKYDQFTISFCSSSKRFLDWIKEFLDAQFPAFHDKLSSVSKSSKDSVYNYSIGGLRAAWIFDNLSKINVPKLDRKWKKPDVLNYIEKQKKKYPQLFNNEFVSDVSRRDYVTSVYNEASRKPRLLNLPKFDSDIEFFEYFVNLVHLDGYTSAKINTNTFNALISIEGTASMLQDLKQKMDKFIPSEKLSRVLLSKTKGLYILTIGGVRAYLLSKLAKKLNLSNTTFDKLLPIINFYENRPFNRDSLRVLKVAISGDISFLLPEIQQFISAQNSQKQFPISQK